MLNVGFSELFLIAVVALMAIGPKELPTVMRHLLKFLREIQHLGDDVKRQMHDVVRESGIDELRTTTIIDLEGKKQQAYDVSELENLSAPQSPQETPRE